MLSRVVRSISLHPQCVMGMKRTVEEMCNLSEGIYEEGYRLGYKIGFKEGREEIVRENVINLASAGLSSETISHMLKVEINLVREWIHN